MLLHLDDIKNMYSSLVSGNLRVRTTHTHLMSSVVWHTETARVSAIQLAQNLALRGFRILLTEYVTVSYLSLHEEDEIPSGNAKQLK